MTRDDLRDSTSVPNVVLAVLVLAVVASLVVAASTSSASYDPYNADWNGAAQVRTTAETMGLEVELARYSATYSSVPANETVALVLSPDSSYRPEELARMNDFVRRGGTLVIADDYGSHANELLRQLGASARFNGRPVRDVRSNYRSPAMPVVTPVADHPSVAGVESLTLNHGTVVEPGEATPLFNTSEHAYIDRDWNGELGPNETLEVHTVATVERVGEGSVVAVGDSSTFINAMLERSGNRNFVRALLSGHSTLVLDHTHTEDLSPAMLAVLAVRGSAAVQLGLGTLAVGVLAIWSRRSRLASGRIADPLGSVPRPWRSERSAPDASAPNSGPSRSELADYLERQHPDWEPERVERVVAALEDRRKR